MKRNKIFSTIFFASLMFVLFTPVIGIEAAGALSGSVVIASFLPMPQNVLGMNNTNNISARATYERAIDMFCTAFAPSFGGDETQARRYVNGLKLSQHEIRLEVNLNATATNFKFALTPNNQNTSNVNQFATENRLQMQDSLVASEYGIFIGQATGNNDNTYQLCTYPNSQFFAAADALALNSAFYSNGSFRLTCNNDVIIPYRGLFNHLYRPQTQQTAALGAASPADEIRGCQDGMITMEPNIVLIGSKGYQPEIILTTALASAAANLRCILIFRGVLAQNSTSVS